jgi:hypothetical protein
MVHLPEYHVVVSQAKMPNGCWGKYGRVGLIRVDACYSAPRTIRHTKHARVVRTWERQFWGCSDRCALRRAEDAALDRAIELNRLNRLWEQRLIGTDVS